MLTEQQHAERHTYIGGSDAGTICGVNPYGNIIDLWREKLQLTPPKDLSDNARVKAGNYLEPVVAQWFMDETGIELIEDPETVRHKEYPFIAANVDRMVADGSAVFEAKTAGFAHGWGEQGQFLIPDTYLCQVAHYVAVRDVERAYIAVLIGGFDFRWYVYERNLKLEEKILDLEYKFWANVKEQTPPEPRNSDEIISLYNQATQKEPLVAHIGIDETVNQLRIFKDQKTKLDEDIKSCETYIKVFMKDYDTLHDSAGKVLAKWSNVKGSKRFDADAFKLEHKDLYDKFVTTGNPTRRFSISK